MRVAIRVDASETIGGGHAMRCLALADTLSDQGADVIFVAAFMPEALEKRIAGAGHELLRIPSSPELAREGQNWEEPPASSKAQLADCEATSVAVGQVQWLVVDHYLLDCRWQAKARSFADRILVIDDLANRPHDCDILLDQTCGRSPDDYRDKVPNGARILTGTTYALLRSEFARERPAALERRKESRPARRVLVSMGTADPVGITPRVVEQLLAAVPQCAVDVVLGPQAPNLERVRKLAGDHAAISIHVESDRMAELMREADLAVGAAGSTSWERCCLGLPSIVFVVAENQRMGASTLREAGAAMVVDDLDAIGPEVERLLGDTSCLTLMSAASFAITDGLGSGRVVETVVGSKLIEHAQLDVRRAQATDIEPLWLWRNDPLMRAMAKTKDPVSWSDHRRWFERVLDSAKIDLYVADLSDEPAAMVRFDDQEDRVLVSINVAPHMRGRGVGKAALESACRVYQKAHPRSVLWAEVRHSNIASKVAFRAAGFNENESDDPSFATFVRSADKPRSTTKSMRP